MRETKTLSSNQMKRILNDKDFRVSMRKIEIEVAKIFGKKPMGEVFASWNGDNKIVVEVTE